MNEPGRGSLADVETSAARALAEAGRLAEAESAYQRILEATPDAVEALTFLSTSALRRGDARTAVQLLQQARAHHPQDPQVLKNLGVAHDLSGNLPAALEALEASVASAPDHFPARLQLAALYERSGRGDDAVVQYFRALTTAQSVGQWLDASTTPPWLLSKVEHAAKVVQTGRMRLFNGCLEPLRARYGASELGRVQQWLDLYLSMRLPQPADARQRPKFMYLPGLPSQPYYPRERFAFVEALEAATANVREELLGCLAQESGVEPFLGEVEPGQLDSYLRGADGTPAWDAFFFYRHGKPYGANAGRCPQTSQLLDRLPLVNIRDHAPEICFSILTAGTHILPHHGVTNTRLVLHLPLVVPEHCAIVVGGETHAWQEGRCVIFDDTYLHEAWNRSERTRAVLIMDVWNPDLSEAERGAITDLVVTIGDFNRASGL